MRARNKFGAVLLETTGLRRNNVGGNKAQREAARREMDITRLPEHSRPLSLAIPAQVPPSFCASRQSSGIVPMGGAPNIGKNAISSSGFSLGTDDEQAAATAVGWPGMCQGGDQIRQLGFQ